MKIKYIIVVILLLSIAFFVTVVADALGQDAFFEEADNANSAPTEPDADGPEPLDDSYFGSAEHAEVIKRVP